ncbi:MAG TPA: hypothetical protein VF521_19310, partial [Pyrinomonadaceae bacterium]
MPRKPPKRPAATAAVLLLALSLTTIGAAAFTAGTVSFTTGAFEVNEGAGTATVTLTRTGGTDGAVVAKVSPAGGTASAADYRLQPGEVDPTFTRPSSISVISDDALAVQPD